MNLAKLAAISVAPHSLFPETRHSGRPQRGGGFRLVGAALAGIPPSVAGPLCPIDGLVATGERKHPEECAGEEEKARRLWNRGKLQKAADFTRFELSAEVAMNVEICSVFQQPFNQRRLGSCGREIGREEWRVIGSVSKQVVALIKRSRLYPQRKIAERGRLGGDPHIA